MNVGSVAVAKVVRILDKLFLHRLPQVPACNKWLACYPILSWAVLGRLLHGIMGRIWNGGVLTEIVQAGAGDGPQAVAAAEESAEAQFRRKRAKRAARIQKWLACDLSQCWATCALFVTSSLSNTLGAFLQDELLYGPDRPHDPNGQHPWVPFHKSGDRVVPTLRSTLADNMVNLRHAQAQPFGVLTLTDGDAHMVVKAFSRLSIEVVSEALQCMVFETLADLYMRFSTEYNRWPYKLHNLVDDGLPDALKRRYAESFHMIPLCCLKPHFDLKLKRLFPTPDALLSHACVSFIGAWLDHQPQATKPVEFAHRINSGLGKAKGVGKPCSFYSVATGFVCARTMTAHQQSLGIKQKRNVIKMRRHPRVERAVKMVKNLKVKRQTYLNRCLNPKLLHLNNIRKQLAQQNLPKAEFYAQVAAAKWNYNNNEQLQRVAKDKWRAHVMTRQLQATEALSPACRLDNVVDHTRIGPWKMGDGFWPVREELVTSFLKEETKCGGLRPLVQLHKDWSVHGLVVGSAFEQGPGIEPEKTHATCFQKHPGLCRTRDSAIFARAMLIAENLKEIKSPLLSETHKPDWSPALDSKPVMALVFETAADFDSFPSGFCHVTFWQLARYKGKPKIQAWMQWEVADRQLSGDWDELVTSLPWEITPVVGETEMDGGLTLLLTHQLSKAIAFVEPVVKVTSILLHSTASSPLRRLVGGVDQEDYIK